MVRYEFVRRRRRLVRIDRAVLAAGSVVVLQRPARHQHLESALLDLALLVEQQQYSDLATIKNNLL